MLSQTSLKESMPCTGHNGLITQPPVSSVDPERAMWKNLKGVKLRYVIFLLRAILNKVPNSSVERGGEKYQTSQSFNELYKLKFCWILYSESDVAAFCVLLLSVCCCSKLEKVISLQIDATAKQLRIQRNVSRMPFHKRIIWCDPRKVIHHTRNAIASSFYKASKPFRIYLIHVRSCTPAEFEYNFKALLRVI